MESHQTITHKHWGRGDNWNHVTHEVYARTFTLGLVRADSPPSVALFAHVSTRLGASATGLGLAVQTLAHVR